MPKYLSGRVKRTPQESLTEDRYKFLGLEQTEPNIGDPPEFDALPSGTQYQIVSFIERPGERFWVPVGGGIIPGSLTIRDESLIVPRTDANPNLGVNSITDINFVGAAITVVGYINPDGSPGTAATVTISAPGENHGVIFNNDGEFATSPYFTFDNSIGIGSVGIGTTNPTQNLHVVGNVKLDRTIYGEDNQPGGAGDLLVKTVTGGVKWVDNTSVDVGAAGTYTQVQFHDATGLLGGAPNFVFDFTNNRIGIGSTQPDRLLDVLGEARFTGFVTFTDDVVFEKNVSIAGTLTYEDVTNVDAIGIITARSGIDINSAGLNVDAGISTFNDDVKFVTDNGNNILFDKSLNKLTFGDNVQAMFGDDEDLKIYHSGNHSRIADTGTGKLQLGSDTQVEILNGAFSIPLAQFNPGGSVVLRHNNSTKFETSGVGVTIFGQLDTTNLSVTGFSTFTNNIDANGDLDVDGHTELDDVNISGIATVNDLDVDGHTELDNLNVSGISTFKDDVEFHGASGITSISFDKSDNSFKFIDGAKLKFGDSGDLEIGHIDNQNIIEDTGNGALILKTNGSAISLQRNTGATMLSAVPEQDVRLYYNGAQKFATSGVGVTVFGTGTDSTIDLSTNDNIVRGKIFADSSDNIGFKDKGGDWNVKCLDDAAVELYYNTTKRIETLVDGGKVTGELEVTEKVGIGTNDPLVQLDVRGSLGISAVTDTSVRTTIASSGAGLIINHGDNSPTIFQNAGIERVRFKDTGEVGIGTAIPEAKLDVNVGSAISAFNIEGSEGQLFSVTNNLSSGSIFAVNDISGTPSINVDADGTIQLAPFLASDKIGIGTTNPQSKLDVFGDTHLDDLVVSGISTFNAGVGIADSIFHLGDEDTQIRFPAADTVTVETGGSERLRIDSTGDVLPGANETQNLGTGTLRWDTLYVKDINASGGSIVVDNYETNQLKVSGLSTFVGFAEFQGSVSIAGTLTYEDVTNIDAIGIITARSGIDITSGGLNVVGIATFDNDLVIPEFIYHAGDLNTKFGFPADDTISFETAGSEKVRITSDGEVGIGTTNPSALIHAQNNSVTDTKIIVESTGANSYPALRIKNDARDYDLGINGSNDSFRIYDVTGTEERFTITSDGKVGIGSATPDGTLTIHGYSGGNPGVVLKRDTGGGDVASIRWASQSASFAMINYRDAAPHGLQFYSGGTASSNLSMIIRLDGKVGIGSEIPTEKLDVGGSGKFSSDLSVGRNLNVSGVSTFSGNIDAQGDLDVDGHTNLDNVSIVGNSTITASGGGTGILRIEGAVQGTKIHLHRASTSTVSIRYQNNFGSLYAGLGDGFNNDQRFVIGKSGTLSNDPIFQASENYNVIVGTAITLSGTTGNATYTGIITATTFVGNGDFVDIDVDGHTELDDVNISGMTSTGSVDVDGNLKITNGHLKIESTTPEILFEDTTNDPDYKIRKQAGHFMIMDDTQTNDTEWRLSIRSGGTVDIPGNLEVHGNVSIGGTLTYEDVTNVDAIGLVTARNGIHVLSQGIVVNGASNNSASTDANDVVVGTVSDVNTGISILGNASTGVGRIMFSDGVGSFDQGSIEYRHADDSMRFSTATSETLRIESGGDVGVGTDNALARLDVYKGTSATDVDIFSVRSKTGAFNIQCSDTDANNPEWRLRTYSNEDIVFSPGGTGSSAEKVRITSDGKVGINRTDPDQRLNVSGNIELNAHNVAGGNGGYTLTKGLIIGNAYDAGITGLTDDRNAIIWQERGLDLDFATDDIFRMKISHNGKVGIGTTNPTTNLHVKGTGTDILKIESTDAGAQGTNLVLQHSPGAGNMSDNDVISLLQFAGVDDSNNPTTYSSIRAVATDVSNNSESGDITFHTRNAGTFDERLRIDSSGHILIGIDASTSNDALLQSFKPTGNNSTIAVGNVATSASGLSRLDFAPSNSTVGARIECHATEDFSTVANRTADLVFVTRKDGTHSEKLRITSAGQVQINRDGGNAAFTFGVSQDFKMYHDAGGPTIFSDANNQGLKLQIKELNLTEYTGGTTRLKIDTSGRVGINETNPIHQLSVGINTSTAWNSTKNISNTTNNDFIGLNLDNSNSGANPEVGIMLQAGASSSGQYTINCKKSGTNTADLIFRTRDGGAASKEVLLINSDGDLLPGGALQDLGSSTNKWDIVYANEFIGEINTIQENLVTGNLFVSGISTFVGVATFHRIGIGTDPSLFLADDLVVGDGQSSRGLTINSDGTTGRILFADGSSGNDRKRGEITYDHSSNSLNFYTSANATARVVIRSGGNVEIDKNLDVDGHTYLDNVNISGVTTFASEINLPDNVQIQLGNAANGDFVLVHDSNDSIINNATGDLLYRSATHKLQALNADDMIVGNSGGSVELYHSATKRLETTGSGVIVTGIITASSANFTGNVSIGGTLTYEDVTNVDAIGIVTARNGIHVLANGIDVVGVSTFDDKVGIGNTVPNATLEVNGPIKTNAGSYTSPHPSGETLSNAALVIPSGSGIYVEHADSGVGRYTRNLIKQESNKIEIGRDGTGFITEVRVLPGNTGFFSVYNDATEAFRVDSNGRVGIGSASPAYTLDFGESASTIRLNGGGNGTAIRMGAGGSGNDFTLLRVDGATAQHDGESNNSNYGFSLKYMGSRTGVNNSLSLFADNEAGTQFEAITVLQDGKVGIKDSTPSYELEVNGTVAATNFDSLSDRRHKTNIQVIENPIEKIKKINGVSFDWKKTNEPSLGVIADNVLEVLPEIVSGEDTKSVNYNGLIGVLIEVVKDQQKQIDELRGLIDK